MRRGNIKDAGASETPMQTFRSRGVCRLFDNIFQSVRGGVI